jgi:hypothetical protein
LDEWGYKKWRTRAGLKIESPERKNRLLKGNPSYGRQNEEAKELNKKFKQRREFPSQNLRNEERAFFLAE